MRKYVLVLLYCLIGAQSWAQDPPSASIADMQKRLRSLRGDHERASLLLKLADAYILKPGEAATDMDTACVLINQATALGLDSHDQAITRLLLLSKLNREKGDEAAGKEYAQQAVRQADSLHSELPLAYARFERSRYCQWGDSQAMEEKIRLLEPAAAAFSNHGRMERAAKSMEMVGECLQGLSRLEEALTPLHRAELLYKAAGVTDRQDLYRLLGTTYANLNDQNAGLRYTLLAAQQMEARHDTSIHRIATYNGVGLAYFRIANWEGAHTNFKKALELAQHYKDTAALRLLWVNLASTDIQKNLFEDVQVYLAEAEKILPPGGYSRVNLYYTRFEYFHRLHQTDSVYKYMKLLQAVLPQMALMDSRREQVFRATISYGLMTKQYGLAAAYADSMLVNSRRLARASSRLSANHWWYKVDSARGRPAEALKYYQQYTAIRDSMHGVTARRELNRMKLEFETEKKDADIRQLELQQQEKEAMLREAGWRMRLIIAGALLLLIGLVFLYNRYQLKRRSNRLLMEQKQVIDRKNETLEGLTLAQQQLLEEKEWLIKEIHHRVKNNLQIVISLLSTQSNYLESDQAREAILLSQNRMYAMSLIHQRLYQSDHLALISMQSYINELINYLRDSFDVMGRIRFMLEVEPVMLDTSQAVPVGLILNEAVTNAIKYAFPGGRPGSVTVVMRRQDGKLLLQVQDNGVGVPPDKDLHAGQTMGISLMRILARQLGGELGFVHEDGLRMYVRFPPDEELVQWANGTEPFTAA